MAEALIWGASGGIGGALVTTLKANGWHVHAAARTESRIPSGADARYPFDASDADTLRETALVVAHETTGLDLVVYAAGAMHSAALDSLDLTAWQSVMDANLNGAFVAAQVSLGLLKPGGHLMAIGAYVDKLGLPKFGAYAAAKAGLEPMMTVLAKENRKLRFTLVRPGAVDTPFWHNVPFSLPKGASSAQAVAEAMLAHHHSGGSGTLDL